MPRARRSSRRRRTSPRSAASSSPRCRPSYNVERRSSPAIPRPRRRPGLQGNGEIIAPAAPAQPVTYNFHTAELTVGYTLDVFGLNRRAGRVAAGAGRAAALRARSRVRHAGLERGRRGDSGGLDTRADRRHRVDHRLGTSARSTSCASNCASATSMRLDVAAQETALAQAQQQLPPLQRQLEQTRDLLRVLVGNDAR